VFILSVNANNSRNWKKYGEELRVIQKSFFVPETGVKQI
jgi:hypothetical protein